MNRRYSTSRTRLMFLGAMLLVAATVLVPSSRADTAADPAAGAAPAAGTPTGDAAAPRGRGLPTIIMENIDPVFVTIGILSVAGLTFIIQGFLQNRRGALMPEATVAQLRELIAQKKYRELIEFTDNDPTFVSRSLNAALKRAPDFEAMKEAMETSVGEQTADQFRKIEYLNIIGNLGPLLGLLGTVWGMIDAFDAMYAAGGNASPGQLAGGVSKALAHTFLGLMLAVPCLAAFGVLRTIIDRITIEAALLSEELLLMIKPADSRVAPSPTRTVGTPQPMAPSPAMPPPSRKPSPSTIAPSPADL